MNMLRAVNNNKILKCDYRTFPHDQSVTYRRKVKIGVMFQCFEESFGITQMKFYVDGKLVKHIWEDTQEIEHTIEEPLDFGEHAGLLEIFDGKEGEFHIKWRFTVLPREENLQVYLGNPHSHTSYSDGKQTPTDAFYHAMEQGLDFMVISDHVGKLLKNNHSCDDDIGLFGGECPKWEMTKIEAEKFSMDNKKFVALAGYELSTRFWGHVNIIDSKDMVKEKKYTIENLVEWIHNHDDVLIAVNHPFKTVGMLPCCSPFNKCIMLYEYGNGSPPRKYKRAEERYFDALDEGWFLGAVNGQDNHGMNWGDGENLTGVLCEKLNKENLIRGLKMRRVFSTESRTLKLSFRVDGYWMGSIINVQEDERLRVDFYAEDMENPIDRIQLISNGGEIVQEFILNGAGIFKGTVDIKAISDRSWYLMKVILADGRVGITSPVFTKHDIEKSRKDSRGTVHEK